jgi:NNP family nitrate/nitrite transporter-like MFS transporter
VPARFAGAMALAPRTKTRAVASLLRPVVSARGKQQRVLQLTTTAFFLSFVVWFNFAPFAVAIGDDLGLTSAQLAVLGLCNLALTSPARIFVGRLLDRVGPRRLYGWLLILTVVPNTVFALADSYTVLVASRLMIGLVGAGFVVGIRMVAEWFEHEEMGTVEGIYGGWGNFGSAAAALGLPPLATAIAGGAGAWRWGIAVSGVVAAVYGVIYLFAVQDTPTGRPYERTRKAAALEVTSRRAVLALAVMQLPMPLTLGLVAWRIERAGVLSSTGLGMVLAGLVVFGGYLISGVVRANRTALADAHPESDRYPFASVLVLSLAYFVTFGAELTVVSLLPTFFAETFGLEIAAASAAGSAFAFTNLITRPGGGIASDVSGSRVRVLVVLLVGTALSFLAMATMSDAWPIAIGIALIALASVFVQGGNGAVFAMVPLVRRRAGGQIAGIAGSYGNVGGVLFSSLLFFTIDAQHPIGNTRLLFVVIAASAALVAVLCRFLPARTPVEEAARDAELDAILDSAPATEVVLR